MHSAAPACAPQHLDHQGKPAARPRPGHRGLQKELCLGNMDAKRDCGYAPEYVEGMWRILQAEQPDDYILATSETHTVTEFVEEAFGHAGLDWEKYITYDARYERPVEVDLLTGDPAKAKHQLGWEPKVRFKELVQIMVDADVKMLGGRGIVHQYQV